MDNEEIITKQIARSEGYSELNKIDLLTILEEARADTAKEIFTWIEEFTLDADMSENILLSERAKEYREFKGTFDM